MAKLENVKILDMVNGEPTRVEYNGSVYEKTEEKAKTGDLVRVIDADYIDDVTQGGFYETYTDEDVEGPAFVDDDYDVRSYEENDHALETFRKVSADLAERLAELERRLEALEERMKPATKEERVEPATTPETEAQAPKFEVGDYVVPLPESDEEYSITNTDMYLAKVTKVRGDNIIIIEIVAHKREHEVGGEYPVEPKHFRKATAEEIEKAGEIARWAKIGRKPGEFKKGDIVRVIDDCGGYVKEGTITEVAYVDSDGDITVLDENNDDWYVEAELIVPVEQRFDFAGAQSVAAEEGAC